MLSNRQIFTLFTSNDSIENNQSQLPEEVTKIIAFDQIPTTSVEKLLHFVAYGELNAAEEMIKIDPTLLLQAGNTVTRSGLTVQRVTAYECALGAGDPQIAEMIASYFEAIPNGAQERKEQYAPYKSAIDNMMTELDQSEKDKLNKLIQIIEESSIAEIRATLKHNKKINPNSMLQRALCEFRDNVRPGKINHPAMHYNYQQIIYVSQLLEIKLNALEAENVDYGDNEFIVCDLIWRQVVGFLQRGLPAVDRLAYSQNLYAISNNAESLKRDSHSSNKDKTFPDTSKNDGDSTGIGFDCAMCLYGIEEESFLLNYRCANPNEPYKKYVEQNVIKLQNLCTCTQQNKLWR